MLGGGGWCSFRRGRLRTEEWHAPVVFLSAQGHLVDAGGTAGGQKTLSISLSLSPSVSAAASHCSGLKI